LPLCAFAFFPPVRFHFHPSFRVEAHGDRSVLVRSEEAKIERKGAMEQGRKEERD